MSDPVEFIFENVEALGPHENLLLHGNDDLTVRIFRALRRDPLPGMKQPSLNGAILGMETILEMAIKGLPATGYRWKLYRDKKLIQSGKTNQRGVSGSIKIGLPQPGVSVKHRLDVWLK